MQPFLVTKVIDGDTFEVSPEIPPAVVLQTPMQRLSGERFVETATQRLARPNRFKKVCLANIDASKGGEQATLYLKELIEGKRITLKPMGVSHDRVVADVWRYPHHVFINAVMVSRGHAQWTSGNAKGFIDNDKDR